eukprot:GHVQ01003752.1.p2 GENE.GHVQ01003752.1~~GHVQ01003752.1.p2  ORF type:complete len:116 (+),score=16.39 GHVQ01003752.1:362-709(+)
MLLSALTLYLFGEFWGLTQDPRIRQWNIGLVMQRLFPFKKTFDFNLTHILLMSVCILLLSLKPDYTGLEFQGEPVRKAQKPQKARKARAVSDDEDEGGDEEESVPAAPRGQKKIK